MKTLLIVLTAFAVGASAQAAQKKSLYERLGGVHKIAVAADICIDAEFNDPMYDTNEKFKASKGMVPKSFVKFSLVNTICAISGGPQKLVLDIAPIDKSWGFSKELRAHAWKAREKSFLKAGFTHAQYVELKKVYMDHFDKVTPMDPTMETFTNPTSLYARLGGAVPISMVVDDFVNMLAADPTIMGNKNVVKSLTEMHVTAPGLKYLVTEQLAAATGGPFTYSGRSMADSHKGLMISEDEWKAGAGILKKVLDKYNVGEKEQGEVFSAIGSMHNDIVGH